MIPIGLCEHLPCAMVECTYLGHVVRNVVVRSQEDKLIAIKHLLQATYKKHILINAFL